MKKEDLIALGVSEEAVNEILRLNGLDVEREKGRTADARNDLAAVNQQLTAAKEEAERLKQQSGGAEDLQRQLDELQSKYDADTAQYQAQLEERDYADAIKRAISDNKVRFSSKGAERAFVAALKEKKLPIKEGSLEGFEDMLKAERENDPESFMSDKPPARFAGAVGTGAKPIEGKSRAAELSQKYHENLYGKAKE